MEARLPGPPCFTVADYELLVAVTSLNIVARIIRQRTVRYVIHAESIAGLLNTAGGCEDRLTVSIGGHIIERLTEVAGEGAVHEGIDHRVAAVIMDGDCHLPVHVGWTAAYGPADY